MRPRTRGMRGPADCRAGIRFAKHVHMKNHCALLGVLLAACTTGDPDSVSSVDGEVRNRPFFNGCTGGRSVEQCMIEKGLASPHFACAFALRKAGTFFVVLEPGESYDPSLYRMERAYPVLPEGTEFQPLGTACADAGGLGSFDVVLPTIQGCKLIPEGRWSQGYCRMIGADVPTDR